jgi:hypothetical protein
MYQAKSLGKNQISGNPRPRRLVTRAGLDEGNAEAIAAPVDEAGPAATPAVTATTATPFTVDVATPAPAAPVGQAVEATHPTPAVAAVGVGTPVAARTSGGNSHEPTDEDEPDPGEVRRQIAAARLNMDPDHQIRRAMDAFLSSPRSNPERD